MLTCRSQLATHNPSSAIPLLPLPASPSTAAPPPLSIAPSPPLPLRLLPLQLHPLPLTPGQVSLDVAMDKYLARLATYKTWSHKRPGSWDCARAGFHALGKEDYVRCAFCGLVLNQWHDRMSPIIEHMHWNPACPFLAYKLEGKRLDEKPKAVPLDQICTTPQPEGKPHHH
jgi:hypothetical protein